MLHLQSCELTESRPQNAKRRIFTRCFLVSGRPWRSAVITVSASSCQLLHRQADAVCCSLLGFRRSHEQRRRRKISLNKRNAAGQASWRRRSQLLMMSLNDWWIMSANYYNYCSSFSVSGHLLETGQFWIFFKFGVQLHVFRHLSAQPQRLGDTAHVRTLVQISKSKSNESKEHALMGLHLKITASWFFLMKKNI